MSIIVNKILGARYGIDIKPSHEGKFTKWCGGKVTPECIKRAKSHCGKDSVRDKEICKMATFAQNAKKWKHVEAKQKGGEVEDYHVSFDMPLDEYRNIIDNIKGHGEYMKYDIPKLARLAMNITNTIKGDKSAAKEFYLNNKEHYNSYLGKNKDNLNALVFASIVSSQPIGYAPDNSIVGSENLTNQEYYNRIGNMLFNKDNLYVEENPMLNDMANNLLNSYILKQKYIAPRNSTNVVGVVRKKVLY